MSSHKIQLLEDNDLLEFLFPRNHHIENKTRWENRVAKSLSSYKQKVSKWMIHEIMYQRQSFKPLERLHLESLSTQIYKR